MTNVSEYIENFVYTDHFGDARALEYEENCPKCHSSLVIMDTDRGQEVPVCANHCGWIGDSI